MTGAKGRALSLVAAGPWIMGYNSPGAQEMFQGMGEVATAMAEGGRDAAVEALTDASFMEKTVQDPAAAELFRVVTVDYSFWAFANPSPQGALDPLSLGRTEDILVRTLVVAGEFDVPACMEIALLLDETIPDSRLEIIPGTGHLMLLERPDQFNQLIIGFLREE